MRLEQKINLKNGVSLIAVLLFMLVATIAATATYKWITSESRSSSSRMMEREAYQSAVAGIESARSWMTYHANDVGALIRQYKTSGNAAIKLNSMLTELVRPGQKFNVWLTGVTTENTTYKLKLVSEGEARNGQAKHTEVAILNVNGLYRVKHPSEHSSLNYEEAFQGRSTGITGNDRLQSGIINGDWGDNNTPQIGNLIVTGNINYGGTVAQTGNLYLRGNLNNTSGSLKFGVEGNKDTNVVYIGGNVNCASNGPIEVHGDLYVGGDVDANCAIDVRGNMTVGGALHRTNDGTHGFTIGKNLVFKDGGELEYSVNIGLGTAAGTGVGASTYLSKISGVKSSSDDKKINLGSPVYLYNAFSLNSSAATVCGRGGTCTDDYCQGFFDGCNGTGSTGLATDRYFLFYSTGNNVSTSKVGTWSSTDNVLKDIGSNYWENITRMNNLGRLIDPSTDEVPQAILLKDTAAWINKLANDFCDLDPHYIMNDAAIEALNNCYTLAASSDRLYEGFLPIRWDYNQHGTTEFTKKLEHNFILYVPRTLGQTGLPPTADNAVVLLYLGQGGGMLMGSTSAFKDYNYFVYSKGDIDELNNIRISGSVMMEPGKTLRRYQGGVVLNYKRSVMQTLINAGLIEENPKFTALINPDATTVVVTEKWDDYYIAIAPQLTITVETQYANKEKIDNLSTGSQTPEASFIVLPRIIYLTQKPKGSLDQYYSAVPLNSKDPVLNKTLRCANQIPVGSKLVTGTQKLEAGIFTCNLTGTVSGKQSTVPFFVVISDNDDGDPPVSFTTGLVELRHDEETTVALTVPFTSGGAAENFVVTVARPATPAGWTVDAINPTGDCAANGSCRFTISSAAGNTDIFTVKNEAADYGQLDFQITRCENGCVIGAPDIESILVASNVTVHRGSLETWCSNNSNGSSDADKAKCAKKSAPDCSTNSEWVQANGYLCSVTETNDLWNCKNTGDISLKVLEGYIPNGCEAVVPGDNLIPRTSLGYDANVTLYASLKAKPYTLSVGFATESDIASNQTIRISTTAPGATEPVITNCSYADYKNATQYAEKCQVQVYYGSSVTLSLPENKDKVDFSYWMCESGSDCPSPKVPYAENTYTLTVTGNDVVHAHFKEDDKHCFFDEFKNASYNNGSYSGTYTNRSELICSESNPEKEYCVDVTNSHPNAKWRLVSGNSDDIQFDGDGRVSLKSRAARTSKESAKKSVTIMSTAVAGLYGTLKAQFQVPREEVALDDEAKAAVKQSGFLLRSEEDASSYLMLNVFSDRENSLKARVCVDGGSVCQTKRIGNAIAHQGDIILVAATLGREGDNDVLVLNAYTDAFSTDFQTVSFDLTQNVLNGVQNLISQQNQYVGYRLSDQNFKVYGIGWMSDDYSSECWDTYPSISCSFRAAYTGGLVPKDQYVKPWVGFSRWFGDDGCAPIYYYNGSDAGCSGTVSGSSNYKTCSSDGYNFTTVGPHGNTVDVDGDVVDGNKTARAGVSGSSCDIYGEAAPWANSAVAAHCGSFWVGEFANCTEHILLEETVTSGAEGTYFGIDESGRTANFRGANLIVTLDNPNGAEVTVYLFSRNSTDGYTYGSNAVYSQPYTSTASGDKVVLNINVNDISNVDGFDPEKVVGAYVKYDDASGVSNVSVHSRCPNAMSLFDCRAEYNQEREEWNVYATVKNGSQSQIKSLNIIKATAGSNEISLSSSEYIKDCSAQSSECAFTGDDISWNLTLDHSPYYYMGSNEFIDFRFWVTMTDYNDEDVEGSPCKTRPTTISKVTTSCHIAENARSKKQGLGLPIMTYSILGCPAGKCGYTVKIMKDGSYVTTVTSNNAVSGNVSNVTTSADAYNNSDTKLPVGTYKMVLESNNENYPFMSCEQEFEILDEQTPSGNLDCIMPEKVMKGSSQTISVTNTLPKQQFSVYLDGGTIPAWSDELAKGGGVLAGPFTVPNDETEHTYVITKAGDQEIQCRGKFRTTKALTCGIQNDVKVGVPNVFVLSDNVAGGYVSKCTYSATNAAGHSVNNVLDCRNNCSDKFLKNQGFTLPTMSPVTLKATCNLVSGGSVSCEATATPVVDPPTVTCPTSLTSPIYAGHNQTITVSPVSVENCGGGCDYWFVTPAGTKKGNGKITTQTSVTFSGSVDRKDLNTYVFHVENSAGSDECNVYVDYSKPKYTCPEDMEAPIGSQVSVVPTNVLACPPITWAWLNTSGGCSYKITGESIDDITGNGYASGAIPTKISGETTASVKEYTLTLTNDLGTGTPCTFKVSYVKPVCHCTCSEGCNNLLTGTVENGSSDIRCVYATHIKEINELNGTYTILVNGKDEEKNRPGYCGSGPDCDRILREKGIEKIDGGYYIEMPATGTGWIRVITEVGPAESVPICSEE